MSKLICYSLFNGKSEHFEQLAYVRGFYFNSRMNQLIYPDWRTHLEVDRFIYNNYKGLFDWMVANMNLSLNINEQTQPLCCAMLWRMKPLFYQDVTHILCRDADALTTYREAQAVQRWLELGYGFHAINDNPAHGGLMGGMVGFDCAKFKAVTGFDTFEQMIEGKDLSIRGSDQHFLNSLLPELQNDLLLHKFKGGGCNAAQTYEVCTIDLPQVNKRLWESNLCVSFIGSAGFNELETLRFFQRFDPQMWNSKTGATGKYAAIEKEFSQLFYWWM